MPTIRMTATEYRTYLAAQRQRKPAKHRNKVVYVFRDGFVSGDKSDAERHGAIADKFDSVKEYERWKQLQLLARAKKISNLRKQVPFLLQPEFTDRDGKLHRATYYNADFVYREEDGTQVVEDVKALDKKTGKFLCTETFRLKWKLLMANHPEIAFRLH